MGRPRAKTTKTEKPTESEEVSDKEPAKINPYDGNTVKHTLDEAVREVILRYGYKEDVFVSNVKIFLGLVAIGLAILAQFGPGKFPANWWMVFGCVAGYVVVTVILNFFSYFVEKDSFLITHVKKAIGVGLRASSKMERYKEEYKLVLSTNEKLFREVCFEESISKFFHEDGYLAESAINQAVEKLLNEFEEFVAPEKKTQ